MSWVLDLCAFDCLLYHRRYKAMFYYFILKYGNQSQGKECEYFLISARCHLLQKHEETCRIVITYCWIPSWNKCALKRWGKKSLWCIHGHVVDVWRIFSPSSLSSGSPVVGQKSGGRKWNTVCVCIVRVCHLGARCFTPRGNLSGCGFGSVPEYFPLSHLELVSQLFLRLCCSNVRWAVPILAVPRSVGRMCLVYFCPPASLCPVLSVRCLFC